MPSARGSVSLAKHSPLLIWPSNSSKVFCPRLIVHSGFPFNGLWLSPPVRYRHGLWARARPAPRGTVAPLGPGTRDTALKAASAAPEALPGTGLGKEACPGLGVAVMFSASLSWWSKESRASNFMHVSGSCISVMLQETDQ